MSSKKFPTLLAKIFSPSKATRCGPLRRRRLGKMSLMLSGVISLARRKGWWVMPSAASRGARCAPVYHSTLCPSLCSCLAMPVKGLKWPSMAKLAIRTRMVRPSLAQGFTLVCH